MINFQKFLIIDATRSDLCLSQEKAVNQKLQILQQNGTEQCGVCLLLHAVRAVLPVLSLFLQPVYVLYTAPVAGLSCCNTDNVTNQMLVCIDTRLRASCKQSMDMTANRSNARRIANVHASFRKATMSLKSWMLSTQISMLTSSLSARSLSSFVLLATLCLGGELRCTDVAYSCLKG